MKKIKLATVWLDGCSGCHMSFLDMDERLIELAARVDLVYSPLVDTKEFPPEVDVAIVEGAVATDEDVAKLLHIRKHSRVLVALGDCGTTGNVPSMRNPHGTKECFTHAYAENVLSPKIPSAYLPTLLERVLPVQEIVPVDLFIPGCPPPADVIVYALSEVLEGRIPDIGMLTRFGK